MGAIAFTIRYRRKHLLSKLFNGAALAWACTASAVAMPMAFRVSGDVVLSDSRAVVAGSRYSMTFAFDALARDHSGEPGRGLYGGVDALVTGFDFVAHTPTGATVAASRHDLATTGSNSLVSVVDHPLGDNWYLNLFGAGLRLAPDDVYLPDFRFTVELGGGTDGIRSKSLAVAPQAQAFESALLGFFRADGMPLLVGTVQGIEVVTAVPEPATAWLLLAGGAGVLALGARRRSRGERAPALNPAPAAS